MTITEALTTVRYVTDPNGEKTDVLISMTAWKALLLHWKELIDALEDQEDFAILQEWLEERAAGQVDMISLEALEQELETDGLISGRSN